MPRIWRLASCLNPGQVKWLHDLDYPVISEVPPPPPSWLPYSTLNNTHSTESTAHTYSEPVFVAW
ncbi:MAG TPA: hypothetical protein PKA63_14225 [Oligoflexia bacterium]|nr:hypothetical protein [Oligoflexia bacterium]HMP49821.1 hypothetical protein [Oligoflexia bacterium]